MPHRHYDLDELLAYIQSDENHSAADAVEHFGLTVTPRAIQKAVNRYLGPLPKRASAVRRDKLRRRVVAWMVASGLRADYCYLCGRPSHTVYIRELRQDDDLGSLVFVCHRCKRPGDV